MNKAELVDSVARETGLSRLDATHAVEATVSVIKEALQREEPVTLVGFGTFVVARRAARVGRNPRTGGKITIPASVLPRFRPGKGLKEAVANTEKG